MLFYGYFIINIYWIIALSNSTEGLVRFLSWNVRGLNSPLKRGKVFAHIKTFRADIHFLQETHLKQSDQRCLKPAWASQVYQSNFTTKARGVAILIRKNFPFIHKLFQIKIAGTLWFKGWLIRLQLHLLSQTHQAPTSANHNALPLLNTNHLHLHAITSPITTQNSHSLTHTHCQISFATKDSSWMLTSRTLVVTYLSPVLPSYLMCLHRVCECSPSSLSPLLQRFPRVTIYNSQRTVSVFSHSYSYKNCISSTHLCSTM